jgi:hypothetical protein
MLHAVFSEAGRSPVEHGPRNSEHPEFPPSSSTKDRQKKLPWPRSWRGLDPARSAFSGVSNLFFLSEVSGPLLSFYSLPLTAAVRR